ncbi:TVP38/TMEM64 family protein [Geobacillus sp. C56-T2]|uniref:TVP38/TMEM64 family protein n=1 Tax=Geobacillus sp. C56-T2 TaxID=600773 RepID=UPI00119F2000|nr:VTT domain-containing protein [Geobacillus sp. C56-T2]NNV07202.1 TVP38/TMEM64 family protein [Geobacillus sp. MMMUD3]TWG30532.1 putative membrane protein YdjX (TVP38/TMEM64 family) [Geobacillus sp. C56-T2]
MEERMIEFLQAYGGAAYFLSLACNVAISVLGVVPSAFLTAANLVVFGFWPGFWISFAGEALGAVVSFLLYRKGFRRLRETTWLSHPKVKPLLYASGKEAFGLIFALRLLPFVPSGVVTFVAAIGRTSFPVFAIASSLGKLPALWTEAYAVNQVIHVTWQGKFILTILSIALFWFIWRKMRKKMRG